MCVSQLKFNICVKCDKAVIVPVHHDKPNITHLLYSLYMYVYKESVKTTSI